MIKAKGKKNGKEITVEYDWEKWLFNGKTDYKQETEIDLLLERRLPFAGTYIPQKKMDPLNIISVLGDYYFDRPVEVETDEDIIEIGLQDEEGVVY